jgi:Mrp family chromosome partitioning ATPase
MSLFSRRTAEEPGSLREGFHEVCGRLQATSGTEKPTVVVAACDHGAGASTLAVELATTAALGRQSRVVLVDGNLRTPSLQDRLGCTGERGLVDLIRNGLGVDEVVQWPAGRDFGFVASGANREDPAAICSSPRLEGVVRALKERFDFVVFDSAPITPYPDAVLLARRMDATVLVLEEGVTRWEVARLARQRLEGSAARLIGAIINKKRHPIPRRLYNLV